MKASFYHVKINVSDPKFYKDLLKFLGFKVTVEYDSGFGASDGEVSIWVFKTKANHEKQTNFEDTGLNHLALQVESREDVDTFYKQYLLSNNISILHEPQEYPA